MREKFIQNQTKTIANIWVSAIKVPQNHWYDFAETNT